jgi:hypothetical protein
MEENKYYFAREIIYQLRVARAIKPNVYLHWIDKLIKDEKEALQQPAVRQRTLFDNLKYWFICRKKGHIVSRVHPKYPSQYCSVCNKHRSEF